MKSGKLEDGDAKELELSIKRRSIFSYGTTDVL
jgi:hypothetical protein